MALVVATSWLTLHGRHKVLRVLGRLANSGLLARKENGPVQIVSPTGYPTVSPKLFQN